ncbi:hypothetical protein DN752_13400 [Echinicola strongylocentroti]|uniref:Tll0287-like domain-containing protein n=1 Tax=Echinicola strongylocentroti TaxID=1795355 RepID=A0A2Z4IK12_9BACT|nr:DUF3365 domain-containing protein [Echinicola strongylocentroti]AWW31039.1 hypothetical protein DN752_13400 [Echinicola strongylocentroti]
MIRILFIVLAGLLVSCGSRKKVDREVFDAVNESMEVKKVNEVDIINKAIEWGNEITEEAQQELMGKLTTAINEKGVAGAVAFCNVEALPSLDEVSRKHKVVIRRVSHDFRNSSDRPNEKEEMLLQAYEYNEENDIQNKPNVQEIENGEILLYTKAITIPGKMCLNCHGDPNKDIDEATLAKIEKLYPQDKAKGHEVGDLRGMWSIAIPKKEVVKQL